MKTNNEFYFKKCKINKIRKIILNIRCSKCWLFVSKCLHTINKHI